MADQVIGRVFVKVTPDTSKFREEAKVKLDDEEKRLPELDVQLNVDLEDGAAQKAAAEARAVRDAAQAAMADLHLRVNLENANSIQSALAQINSQLVNLGAIDLPVDINEDSLNAAKELLEEQLRNVGVDIKVDLDDQDSIKRAIAQIDAQLSDLRAITLNVDLNEASLEAAKAELQAKLLPEPVEVKPEVSKVDSAEVSAALAFLTRTRDVVIKPTLAKGSLAALSVVDVLSGFRALRVNVLEAHNALLKLFTNLPQIGAMSLAFLGLGGAAISATGNIIGLGGSLVQLLPLAAALPGIAIGIGTMVVALKELPNQLPSIVEGFKNLQTVISDAFFKVAKGPINDLLTATLPLLKTGLASTSTAIGGFFAALSGALGSDGGFLDQLPAMFDRLAQSIQIFTDFTPALASIMTSFGVLGSSLLPPLAALMGQVATEFANWLQTALAGDGVTNVVNSAIAALGGLFEVIKGVAGVFSQLWAAASSAGAATLGSLGEALQGIAATLGQMRPVLTAFFQSAFTMFANFAKQAGPAFSQIFGGITSILTTILPQVGSVFGKLAAVIGGLFDDPAVQNGLTAFLQGVVQGVSALLPALAPVGQLIAGLGPVLGQLAAQIGQVFAALAPSFEGLMSTVGPLIDVLGGALVQVLQGLAGPIQSVIDAITPVIAVLGQALGQVLAQLVPLLVAIGQQIAQVFQQLMPALTPVITLLGTLIAGLLPLLMPIIQQLTPLLMSIVNAILPVIAALLPVIAELLGSLIQAATPILGLITELITLITPVLIPALTFLAEIFAGALAGAIDGVIKVITGVLNVLIGLINFIVGVFTRDWDQAWQGIQQIFKGIADIIVGIIEYLWNIGIIGVFRKGFAVIKGAVTEGWAAIKGFFSGGASGIMSSVRGGIDAVVGFFKGLWSRISGAISSLWSTLKSRFSEGMQANQKAVSDGIGKVVKFFKDLPGKALSALGDLSRTLFSAGVKLIQGFIDGIGSMFGKAKDKLGDLTGKLTDWKGPEDVDRVILFDAGRLVIEGFINGLESRYDAVRDSLAGLTKDVADTDFKAPTASLGVNAGLYTGQAGQGASGNTLIYNAAPNNSLPEDDLFDAMGRGRAFAFGFGV